MATQKTLVGSIDDDVLAFTVGKDPVLDLELLEADCIGTAAHVRMLSKLKRPGPIVSVADSRRVVRELVELMRLARAGRFRITLSDQDVHLAVERLLTERLGDLGKRVHTARSRNDQVAVDLRLYAKEQLLGVQDECAALAGSLLRFARRHVRLPMVGRTHLQPAMPSTVGLWASSYAEGLLDDLTLTQCAFELNDRCPLGSAAGFGVPLPIDRRLTARLLGFREPIHNVLYAASARGKDESIILGALGQIMLTLSRFAEDLILYSLPELGYFQLPAALCTGSSIMPQKRNPDVLELVRSKAARVLACGSAVTGILKALPGGYNRDLQDTKEPFMEGVQTTRATLRILASLVDALGVHRAALLRAFGPEVFATDRALELVAAGVPFREAYRQVRENLAAAGPGDCHAALARRTHLGGAAGLDLPLLARRVAAVKRFAATQRRRYYGAVSRLLGVRYPGLAPARSAGRRA